MKKSAKKQGKQLRTKSKPSYVPKKLGDLIVSGVARYIGVLGMNHYRSKVSFMKRDADTEFDYCNGHTVAATAVVDHRYLTVQFRVFPHLIEQWKKKLMTDEEVNEIIAHEVSHVATNHLYRMAVSVFKDEGETKDAWESLTTVMGRLLHEVDGYRRRLKTINKKKK